MNEEQSLDALAKVLNDISERPYDLSLHKHHVQLSQSLDGMEGQVTSACEMFVDFLAAGELVWTMLIEAKEKSADLRTAEGVEEVLAVYTRAEADYLSIPILQKHLQFLIDHHEQYASENSKPDALGDLFSTPWTRTAITEVVNKGLGHLAKVRAAVPFENGYILRRKTQSNLLWDVQRDWELQQLEVVTPAEKYVSTFRLYRMDIDLIMQERSSRRHPDSEETLQYYSTFTTNHRPPAQYEPLLVTASKAHARALKSLERRDHFEATLVKSGFSLEEHARYIAYERRARNPDLFVMVGVFERAIAEADKRRFNGEAGAEEALRMFWAGFTDVLRINDAGEDTEMGVLRRAVRSVPGCGEIWARYMRALERHGSGAQAADVFNQAFGMGLVQSDVEQIVPVVLSYAGHLRRRAEVDTDEDILPTLIATLENVIVASKAGDPKLRLEKCLAAICQQAGLTDNAITVWEVAAKFYKTSYLAWTSFTETLIKYQQYERAEKVFLDIHTKNLDWPEAIWEAWINFEQLYGSVEGLEQCLDKVETAQYQVNVRRAKEAEKAGYEAMQTAMEAQPSAPEPVVPVMDGDVTMDVDVAAPHERGTKREAEDEPEGVHKKAKIEQKPAPLKRDRENSTVFVGDLPAGITEEELTSLFKDCGKVREVKITQLAQALVATVEFFDRDSVPAALTKDKKQLHGQEVAVHLAWKSTLYVTNFPESADDAVIRDLFGQYGTIFDVRWPSKKFKNTRRFCYIQFTSPTSAQNALELHERELEPNQAMNVFISNPERKKERTDQDANEREVYVAGLSKFTTQVDLDKLFKTYGTIKEIRMATDDKGHSKGFAFIEYESEVNILSTTLSIELISVKKDALTALSANNHELKKRRIAVTLADSRARGRASRNAVAESGLSKVADVRTRSVRIRNLPAGTQEGLLQQTLEKLASVKRVEVFVEQKEAVVELENVAEAGKLLLRTDPIVFNGNTLQFSEERRDGAVTRPAAPAKTGGLFVPRSAVSRPRAGLGHARKPAPTKTSTMRGPVLDQTAASSLGQGKGQDDFRKMLGGK
ncbi:hypothetical protein C0991_007968 [Blastosporella zonata]|nr:hypothetical protein C0991_007968 [Blastosporella zonata]